MEKCTVQKKNILDSSDLKPEQLNGSGKGKILKIKQGYNPNSSSIGSVVFVLPTILLGVGVVFGAVSGFLMSHFLKKTDTDSSAGNTPNTKK